MQNHTLIQSGSHAILPSAVHGSLLRRIWIKHIVHRYIGDTTFRQPFTYAWTYPDTQWVINHLDSEAFKYYAKPMINALRMR
jgi:hypothetical protein